MNMARYGAYEADRRFKRANEISSEATAEILKGLQALADDHLIPTHTWYLINKALPGAALTEKERNLLCPT